MSNDQINGRSHPWTEPRRRSSVSLHLRFNDIDAKELREYAMLRDQSVSGFVRYLLKKYKQIATQIAPR